MPAFTHRQTTPSTTWNINHGMHAQPIVSVQVVDKGVMQVILPTSVEFPDQNNVIVRFTSARSGVARLA